MPNLTFATIVKRKIGLTIGTAGINFSVVVYNDGKSWSWGNNPAGNLGDNSTTERNSPVCVCGSVKTFCNISTHPQGTHVLALDKNGRAWAWGTSGGGRLGDNSPTNKSTPVSVCGTIRTFCRIAAGNAHSLAIDKNGRAWAWGTGSAGALGDNSVTAKSTPVCVCGTIRTFCQITGGVGSSMAIDNNGRAWSWGSNTLGQLGDNSTTSKITPVSVCGTVKTFCQITMNGQSLAIDKNGRLWGWGDNTFGQLGINITGTAPLTPVSVCGNIKTFCRISAGTNFTLAIDKDGRAWAWGINTNGQLGDNTIVNKSTPVSVAGALKTFCQIYAGNNESLAIDKNGKAWSWGLFTSGQLGLGFVPKTPLSICGTIRTFCQISGGGNGGTHSLAIDKDGRAWAWGGNANGQLGDQSTASKFTPVCVCGTIRTFCKISAGAAHSLAIDKNGRVWAWGSNGSGRLGDNSVTQKTSPVCVCGAIKTFCLISAGGVHSLGIDKNGRAWAWGGNTQGNLGQNSTTARFTPVCVCGVIKTFCHITIGGGTAGPFSLAIDKNGRAWGWGSGSNGTLGNNATTARSTPVCVCGAIKTFCQISSGLNHTSVIDKDGRAWAWGLNSVGQLGQNSTATRCTPVSVCGTVKTFCKISSGTNFTLAIDKNGRIWSWGTNGNSQLGDNSTTSRSTPISVCGAIKTFCHISAGSAHSLAIDKNGRVWAWGDNGNGQLGINFNPKTPIMIPYI